MSAGKLKWNMHTDEVTQKLLETFPDISWVSVSIKGTNALVKIVEAIPQPEMIDKITPSNLIAKKDSVIQSITTEAGTPIVQSGDVVKKGALLISGEVIIAAGEEAEVGREYIHARGTILGKVWYTLEESVPLQYTEKMYTGEEKKDKSIMIGNTILNVIQPNMEDSTYDKEKTGMRRMYCQNQLIYTVQAGDTLWAIARTYGTTVDAIQKLNGLTGDVINIGQVLKIPR